MTNAFGTSDEAKRMADTVTMHAIAGGAGRWCAIRLSDGGSDNVLYDTRTDAINHQLHETQCSYVFIPPTGMTTKDAQAWIDLNRACYDAGWHLSDPDHAPITPVRQEDALRKIRQLRRAAR